MLYCGVSIHLARCVSKICALATTPISSVTDTEDCFFLWVLDVFVCHQESIASLPDLTIQMWQWERRTATHHHLPMICSGLHIFWSWRGSPYGIYASLHWETCSVVAKEPISLWRDHWGPLGPKSWSSPSGERFYSSGLSSSPNSPSHSLHLRYLRSLQLGPQGSEIRTQVQKAELLVGVRVSA